MDNKGRRARISRWRLLTPLVGAFGILAVPFSCSNHETGPRSTPSMVGGAAGAEDGGAGFAEEPMSAAGTAGELGRADGGAGGAFDSSIAGEAGANPVDPACGQQSVLERGNNPARTAHFIDPALTTASVAKRLARDVEFQANFAGHVLAVPLYLAPRDCAGKGEFIVVTLENDVLALSEETGATIWSRNLGAPAGPGAGIGVVSRGIMSTPVIDGSARVVYLVAAVVPPGKPMRHEIHAIDADTGAELGAPWPIDVSALKAGSLSFDAGAQHQRSALSLVGGTLYVAFGGNGDSPIYRGWVITVNTKEPSQVDAWATRGVSEGIWAPGGMASDGNGVFAVTGNSHSANGDHSNSDGEEVIRITERATPHRDDANVFIPSLWSSMDTLDLDFSSSSPLLLQVPNSVPRTVLVAPSKPGHVYFLDPNHLGGLGGELADLVVGAYSESTWTVPTSYATSRGIYVAINVRSGATCPNGVVANYNLLGFSLEPGQPPQPRVRWCAQLLADNEVGLRSPISTTSDGHSNAIVWFMNGNKINAFDGETGTPIFAGGSDECAGVHRFTSPIVVGGRVVVGGDGHLCSWSVH